MRINRTVVVLDAADLHAVSSFWAGLYGGTVDADDEDGWHTVLVDGEPRIGVQHAPDHVAPQWPDGEQQQVHLDVYIGTADDLAAAHDEAVSLGARMLQRAEDLTTPDGFQVYADPAGHPFCLCWVN
jgi:predicted enzyme related to lactoylglutathione lyase